MPNAIHFYYIARWLYEKHVPLLPKIIQLLIFLIYNSKLPPSAKIGKGSFLVCKGIGVVIIDNAILGEGCRIGIGSRVVGKGPYKNVAQIGNNVFIGPGAVVVGAVIIEDNVVIAPNSVVTKSVPEGAVVGGVPAKILGHVKDLEYDILKNESYIEGYVDYLQSE